MKQRILTMLICLAVSIGAFAQQYTDENGVTWNVWFNSYYDGTTNQYEATIYQGVSGNTKDLVVPEIMTYNNQEYKVTGIAYMAFCGREDIETIVLPKTIKYINPSTWSELNGIMDYYGVFSHNTKLKSVDFSGAACNIGNYAFYNCASLESVTGLSSCTSIEYNAFYNCSSLTTVGDLSSCTSIGGDAFYNCISLTTVGDLSSCTSIGGDAFYNCISLATVGDLSSCTSIGYYAFFDCRSLTTVGDLSSCTSIEYYAFYNCISLATVGDLSSCTSIGDYAFYNCISLATVGDLSSCTSIEDSAFRNCSSLTTVGDLSSCTFIRGYAFSDCRSLTTVGDLSSCTSIGFETFQGCRSLTTITLPSNKVVACEGNFCNECTSVFVPENLLNTYRTADYWKDMAIRILPIGIQTDYDVEVTANDNSSDLQTKIGAENLENVINLKVKGTINGYDFMVMRNKMVNLHNLDLSEADIVEDENHYCYYEYYSTQNNVFPAYSFYHQRKIASIVLPKSIMEIGTYSLASTSISNIEIPQGVVYIGSCSFESCYLQKINMPNSVLYIYDNAFASCYYLRSVSLPDCLQYIGCHAFVSCNDLLEITLPSSITYVGDGAFRYCDNLNSVYVSNVEPFNIGQNTFSTWTTATLFVPKSEDWDATYNAYYWDTQWSQFAHIDWWTPDYKNFYIDNDYELDNGQIPGDNPDGNFGNNSGFIVDEDANQDMGDANMSNDGENGASIIANDKSDGTSNVTAEKLNIKIDVNSDRWYFFCFPYDIAKEDITCDANYVFRHYDGNGRANGNSGWKDVSSTSGEYLKAGKGYIFQCDKYAQLILTIDNPEFASKNQKHELEENQSSNAQDASWNFVGNPFLSYFNMDELYYDAPITVWNGYSYEAIRPGDDDYSFHPFQAFFVQKPEGVDDIVFGKDGRETKRQSEKSMYAAKVRRALKKASPDRQLINLTITDGENTDKTRVVFNGKKADTYELDCDAAKFMSTESVPQIYTIDNKAVKYAINERPDGIVKLGYVATKGGSLTISASKMDKEVSLLDKMTGEIYSLDEDYTFETLAGTFDNRFELMIGTPTEIKSVNAAFTNGSADAYNLSGNKASDGDKGVVIINGKKYLNK